MGTITKPKPAPKPRQSPVARIALVLFIGVVGAAAVVVPYWYFKIRPRIRSLERHGGPGPSRATSADLRSDPLPSFDLVLDLPGDPLGIAWNGDEAIIGNRLKPWGFMRLRRDGDSFEIEKVPVRESEYNQTMDFWGVTWNGTNYIGHTSGAWFQKKEQDVFTIHDPKTLRILDWKPAPPDLGCLAWDGQHYWAATRKNTEETGEPTFLWKLDAAFNVVAKYPPPSVGCQGMAWDGAHLWIADVFSDAIYVLDVSGETPSLVHQESTPLSYLSGVGFDGREIWIAEYDDNRLHRVKPRLRAAWKGVAPDEPQVQIATMVVAPASDDEIEELERKLRGEDDSDRFWAARRLRELGLPVTYDREIDAFPEREREEASALDWSAELRDDAIYASWHLHFGEDLFNTGGEPEGIISIPKFAKYTVTIKGGTLDEPVEREFTATPGDNIRRNVLLVSGIGNGDYELSLFIHVQYRTPDGTDRILNRSAMSLELGR